VLGLDLGDRSEPDLQDGQKDWSGFGGAAAVDHDGERAALLQCSSPQLVALESGSPQLWMTRLVKVSGHEVIVPIPVRYRRAHLSRCLKKTRMSRRHARFLVRTWSARSVFQCAYEDSGIDEMART